MAYVYGALIKAGLAAPNRRFIVRLGSDEYDISNDTERSKLMSSLSKKLEKNKQ